MSLEHTPVRMAKSGNSDRILITDIEAAALIGCSRSTIWRHVAAGILPKPVKIGGLTRFVLAEIMDRVDSARDGNRRADAHSTGISGHIQRVATSSPPASAAAHCQPTTPASANSP